MCPIRAAIFCLAVGIAGATLGCRNDSGQDEQGSYKESDVKAVDARKVLVDPEKYSGQTLRSNVRIAYVGASAAGFELPGSQEPLYLSVPKDMQKKLARAQAVYGREGFVVIVYRFKAEGTKVEDVACHGDLLNVSGL